MVTKADEEELRNRLGAEIRKARLAKGYTQADLAEHAGTDPETISRFERGATMPSISRLFDLATLLEVGVASLLGAASPADDDELDQLRLMLGTLSPKGRTLIRGIVKVLKENE